MKRFISTVISLGITYLVASMEVVKFEYNPLHWGIGSIIFFILIGGYYILSPMNFSISIDNMEFSTENSSDEETTN